MAPTDLQNGVKQGADTRGKTAPRGQFKFTFVDSSSTLGSIVRQIRERWREPKITVPRQYYRGETRLPITEMRQWYMDLPATLRIAFEEPRDPIGKFNRTQTQRRAFLALGMGAIAAAALAVLEGWAIAVWGAVIGMVAGELLGLLIFRDRPYPPDIFQDYRQQTASWVNSLLVHGIMLAAITVPFIVFRPPTKVVAKTTHVIELAPYVPTDLQGPAKKTGGGGGGGDRSPLPASKGALPKFSKTPLAPPQAKIEIPHPQIAVQPELLGPPQLKLPQMAKSSVFGDPQGVLGPASNGPGTGGGIGTGNGPGIGSGTGGGFGPGEGGGYGGGAYSVGGGVSAPSCYYEPEPPYSEEARKAKYQGVVVLLAVVQPNGAISDAKVLKPLGLGLDEKAVETVKTWKCHPGEKNGTAVPVRVTVEVTFRLF
jgi:periplasmic protein TonB